MRPVPVVFLRIAFLPQLSAQQEGGGADRRQQPALHVQRCRGQRDACCPACEFCTPPGSDRARTGAGHP